VNPEPLPPGTLLADRFLVESVIGSGGFSIVYLASDRARHDRVVVKELAPKDSRRGDRQVMDLGPEAHRLRRKFLEEGALQAKLKISGLVSVRSWFAENGTAYVVSEYMPEAVGLDRILREHGRLDRETALVIFYRLLDIVEAIHLKGILHRDIKPSNILIGPQDGVWLIDFGAAREWRMDAHTQTVLFTPGFAPPEQLSERARRGPATDIYALSGTLYQMLTGDPPSSVAERANGTEPDYEKAADLGGIAIANAIRSGLELKMLDRPQTVVEFRSRLEAELSAPETLDLEALDDALYRASQLSFGKRECPACGGVLETPNPLRKNACPVCREGLIMRREILEGLCPVCRTGVIHRHENIDPPFICPWCETGVLHYRREGVFAKSRRAECPQCHLVARWQPGTFEILTPGPEPRLERGRADIVWQCDGCEAQFDERPDSRLEQISPPPRRFTALYPEEWARVASGLEPGAGDAECGDCGAEFFTDGQTITLLGSQHDPNGFVAGFEGRRIPIDDLRWIGAGKMSPHRGYVCEDCGTEFDFAGSELLLVHSANRSLAVHSEEAHDLENWHRVAQGLPLRGQENDFRLLAPDALREAYLAARIGFDGRPELAWKGPARRVDLGSDGTLTIDGEEISFGGLLRKWKRPRADLQDCAAADETQIDLVLQGDEEPIEFDLTPMDLTAHLKAGAYTVGLTAHELCARLTHHVVR
jgi:tRNA A-37 threonylcarbamoyl transferase component Bud32